MPKSMIYGGLAGAAVIIINWAAKAFAHVEIPVEVAASIQLIIQALVHQYYPDEPTHA